jgi:hypothetical protein
MSDNPWTDERIAKLTVYIRDEKMSATQATAAFRAAGFICSRNAVVGKMWRLGLHSTHIASKRTVPKVQKLPRPKVFPPEPKLPPEPIPSMQELASAPEPLRTSILDLTSEQCRWMLDDEKDQHGLALFCGHFAADGRYCEHHHGRCNIPLRRAS